MKVTFLTQQKSDKRPKVRVLDNGEVYRVNLDTGEVAAYLNLLRRWLHYKSYSRAKARIESIT